MISSKVHLLMFMGLVAIGYLLVIEVQLRNNESLKEVKMAEVVPVTSVAVAQEVQKALPSQKSLLLTDTGEVTMVSFTKGDIPKISMVVTLSQYEGSLIFEVVPDGLGISDIGSYWNKEFLVEIKEVKKNVSERRSCSH